MTQTIQRFLDEEGRLKQWPAKHAMKDLACLYLAEKFEYDTIYTEPEVNAIVATWHTFGDYFLLRRALVERGHLQRTQNGSQYWKNREKKPSAHGGDDPTGDEQADLKRRQT